MQLNLQCVRGLQVTRLCVARYAGKLRPQVLNMFDCNLKEYAAVFNEWSLSKSKCKKARVCGKHIVKIYLACVFIYCVWYLFYPLFLLRNKHVLVLPFSCFLGSLQLNSLNAT